MGEDHSWAATYAKVIHEVVDSDVLHSVYRQQIRDILVGCQINCPQLEEKIVAVITTVAEVIAKNSIKHAQNLIDSAIEDAVRKIKGELAGGGCLM